MAELQGTLDRVLRRGLQELQGRPQKREDWRQFAERQFAESQFAERKRHFAELFSANCPFEFAEFCMDNLPNT